MTAKYIKMGVDEWYTEVYKCIILRCGCDDDEQRMVSTAAILRNCGAAFTQEENDERSE